MKITVINLKKIIKYIFIFFIIIILLALVLKLLPKKEVEEKKEKSTTLIECLKYELPITRVIEENCEESIKPIFGVKILSMQIGIFDNIIRNTDNDELEIISQPEETYEDIEEAKLINEGNGDLENKETKVISENNINEKYTNKYQNIKINNQTSYDISGILENASYNFNDSRNVIMYHTHTCESYTPTENYNYEMTDSYRTTNLNFTVSKVGDELSSQLEKQGFTVIHSKAYHDYPSYNGSYGRSLTTLENMLSQNKNTEIVIDLHRDAVGSKSNYAPSVQIGDEVCAQVMFVVGTDGSGLEHANWRKNLQYAIKVQSVADELYPGLFRPIILRNARYNQHLTNASTIVEVGATGNTLEQCLASMKYVANVLKRATEI